MKLPKSKIQKKFCYSVTLLSYLKLHHTQTVNYTLRKCLLLIAFIPFTELRQIHLTNQIRQNFQCNCRSNNGIERSHSFSVQKSHYKYKLSNNFKINIYVNYKFGQNRKFVNYGSNIFQFHAQLEISKSVFIINKSDKRTALIKKRNTKLYVHLITFTFLVH